MPAGLTGRKQDDIGLRSALEGAADFCLARASGLPSKARQKGLEWTSGNRAYRWWGRHSVEPLIHLAGGPAALAFSTCKVTGPSRPEDGNGSSFRYGFQVVHVVR